MFEAFVNGIFNGLKNSNKVKINDRVKSHAESNIVTIHRHARNLAESASANEKSYQNFTTRIRNAFTSEGFQP